MPLLSLKKQDTAVADTGAVSQSEVASITESLYKQNLELAVKNKTLSLLRKLYQISILVLDPPSLAKQLTSALVSDLELEYAVVFDVDEKNNELDPLAFTGSGSFTQKAGAHMSSFLSASIDIDDNRMLSSLLGLKQPTVLDGGMYTLWGTVIDEAVIGTIITTGGIKDSIIVPLMIDGVLFGVLVFGMNRQYADMIEYEREAIGNYANVIAVALDKAIAYKKIGSLNSELGTANEKLKGLDKLKTEFLSLAAHQLRSPLTAIKGYTSMLLEGSYGVIDKGPRDIVDRVYQSSIHLAMVIEDLLNVSKIEQGGMQYIMTPFDIRKTTQEIANDLSITAQKKGLTFTFTANTEKQCVVFGDMEKIRQVILNLIDNSIKYTPTGSVAVNVDLHENGEKKVTVSIKDTGIGVSEEYKKSVFEKFERGEGGKLNTTGSGLGLYLAKQIVEAHKGKIWLESEGKGKGATFFIEFKELKPGDSAPTPTIPPPAQSTQTTVPAQKI